MILLIIRLKNGTEVSGRYSWENALSMLRFAANQPDYLDFDMREVA